MQLLGDRHAMFAGSLLPSKIAPVISCLRHRSCQFSIKVLPQHQAWWTATATWPAQVQPYSLNSRRAHTCAMATSGGTGSATDKNAARTGHNQRQAAMFSTPDVVHEFMQPLPADIEQRLKSIIGAIPGLSPASRVIDVGSGTGCLIPHLQARGVQDILEVDLSQPMLDSIKKRYASSISNLGNELGVRTWQGDVMDLPNYLGWAADVFIFNAVFGNLYSPQAALLKVILQLKQGGHIVISHPLGRRWHTELAAQQPDIVPHQLPDRQQLDKLIKGLPLQVVEFRDDPELYLAVLQVPPLYRLASAPVYMKAKVVAGFGRGSRQLGTPTANLDPVPLQQQLASLERGVYYGWARLAPTGQDHGPEDLQVHKMVMNVGRRPTVNTGDEAPTVEVHMMHTFPQDFYGQEVQVVALGFIRPEMKFPSLTELLNRIKLDIAIGRNMLDMPENKQYADDPFLQG